MKREGKKKSHSDCGSEESFAPNYRVVHSFHILFWKSNVKHNLGAFKAKTEKRNALKKVWIEGKYGKQQSVFFNLVSNKLQEQDKRPGSLNKYIDINAKLFYIALFEAKSQQQLQQYECR